MPKKTSKPKVTKTSPKAAKKPVAKKAAAPAKKKEAKVVKAKAAPAPKPVKVSAEEKASLKRRSSAAAAMKAALEETSAPAEGAAEEEFDPAAFFAASGGKGIFRAHVMRKERVDLNLIVRYRLLKGPLVYNAELLNLSKGGLALKTPEIIKLKTVIRIEIPLPHTSELFAIQAEVVWSDYVPGTKGKDRPIHTGFRFLPMSLAKQSVINTFIQQRRDEIIMSKIGLDKFRDSVPVAGLD